MPIFTIQNQIERENGKKYTPKIGKGRASEDKTYKDFKSYKMERVLTSYFGGKSIAKIFLLNSIKL
ncbi:hypothetical protein [endosymbiont GvMRE of Glomus versiforme]|uniref:hypothetical protein n=1 Tax=endosymbiont GvMRE of Glomus versiforme TaxID=2039283 RepID=UPI000EDE19B5|nr:hypothetical protein [endosymbiont GvMRE of Glomus versiforme]RHZ35456.1 hypothetical protein GvMRE_IIg185 [endosymbiont GvMRE of Glomus versiforme]